jgi:murein L,D-transpeptidase YcbB/YkuD
MRNYSFFFVLSIASFLLPAAASASTLFSQAVTLAPGWNVVSTPRILDSHTFSATENSTNFDIYVLDASQTSGWATMAQEGQAEFTPLYGYFIDNKTASSQTLTFNYKDNTNPASRLFQRTFSTTGWGTYGPLTASAIKKYQSAHSLEQTGTIGPKTRALLNAGSTTNISQDQDSVLIAQLRAQVQLLVAKLAALTASSTSH